VGEHEEASRPLRVLLADDHPVVRRGMTALLGSLVGIEVVGEATTGSEAVREAQLLRPDVVVMDLQMPSMNGVEATARLQATMPQIAVLVLTMFEDDETVLSAIRAGARGYLLKGTDSEAIHAAIRAVHAGQLVIGPVVAQRLVELAGRGPATDPLPQLTSREREVLTLAEAGLGNAAMAARLGLAPKTVANNMSAILVKLGVTSRAEAVLVARQNGIGQSPNLPLVPRDGGR